MGQAQEARAGPVAESTKKKAKAPGGKPGHVQVSVTEQGKVGLWCKQPRSMLHMHSDDPARPAIIHTSGSTAGLSFQDRSSSQQFSASSSERWEWYSTGGSATLAAGSKANLVVTKEGNVGIGTSNPSSKLHVAGTVQCKAVVQQSSRTLKTDIVDMPAHDARVLLQQLSPVTFEYKHKPEQRVGFIAEDVPAELQGGDGKSVNVTNLVGVLTAVVRQQRHQLDQQDQQMAAMRQRQQRNEQRLAALLDRASC